jgi:hypothetical protein
MLQYSSTPVHCSGDCSWHSGLIFSKLLSLANNFVILRTFCSFLVTLLVPSVQKLKKREKESLIEMLVRKHYEYIDNSLMLVLLITNNILYILFRKV